MTDEAERPRLFWRIVMVVGVFYALSIGAQNLTWLANLTGALEHWDYGAQLERPPGIKPGIVRVVGVRPGSSAEAVGLVVGDVLRADQPLGLARFPRAGDRLQVSVEHAGRARSVTLTASPSHTPVIAGNLHGSIMALLGDMPAALLGLFILIRSRARSTPVLLGLALASFAEYSVLPPPGVGWPSLFPGLFLTNLIGRTLVYPAFLGFGIRLLDSADGRHRRWLWLVFGAYSVALVVSLALAFAASGAAGLAFGGLSVAGMIATLACLVAGLLLSRAEERRRYLLLVGAFVCVLANQLWNDLLLLVFPGQVKALMDQWPMLALDAAAGVVGPVLLAYAILRHRILDLGFALNRTLVYSAVSAILLAAFGLIEWAVDHLVKIDGREQNALIDAAIALVVFLGFHRVRDWVERGVEVLFFRRWQEKEAALRRFVADAAFITRKESLAQGFAAALSRFADGAGSALYLTAMDGTLARVAGRCADAADRLDPDDPALVRMRAERKPVEPAATGSPLPAALACPMFHRAEMTGLVLLAARTAQTVYRPDEEALLGWATLQVGLDLHALEVEALQATVVRLEHQLEGARRAGALAPAGLNEPSP